MNRRRAIGAILVVAAATLLRARSACAENLREAWEIANAVDRHLDSSRRLAVAAGFDHMAAKSERMPKLQTWTASAFLTSPLGAPFATQSNTPIPAAAQENFTFSLTTLGVPIYTGGRITNTIASKAAKVDAARADEFTTAIDLRLNVAVAYVGVLRAMRSLAVARSSVASLAAQARDVGNLVKEGRRVRNDLLAAQVSLANARQREIQQRNNLSIAWATYNRYLGRPLGTVVALDDLSVGPIPTNAADAMEAAIPTEGVLKPEDELEVHELTALALRNRSEPAQLLAQVEDNQAQARSQRAATRPQVHFYMVNIYQNTRFFPTQPDFGAAAFVLNWTPFDGGKARRTARAYEQRALAYCSQQADLASNIALQVRTAWLNTRETRLRIPVTRAAIDQAEENLRVSRSRYVAQRGTNTEVLDAETLRVQSYDNYYNAIYDAVVADLNLHRAVGDLR